MARHKYKVLTWVVILLLIAPLLLAGYVALEVLFLAEYRHEHGYTSEGAGFKWHTAMNEGDAAGAKYWAHRMIQYSSDSPALSEDSARRPANAYRCLAAAHELAGEYEAALALYRQYPAKSVDGSLSAPLAMARVYWKLGNNEEAFRAYCEYAAARSELSGGGVPKVTKGMIVGYAFPYEKALSPFRTYDEFLYFMRREWKRTGKAEEYREPMQFLESIR
jgi:hypothetical protein